MSLKKVFMFSASMMGTCATVSVSGLGTCRREAEEKS